MEKWLYARGFERGNPFRTINAEQEQAYLAESIFVPVPDYDSIRGDQTMLVLPRVGVAKAHCACVWLPFLHHTT